MKRESDFIPIEAIVEGEWEREAEDIKDRVRAALPKFCSSNLSSGATENVAEISVQFRDDLLKVINNYANAIADTMNTHDVYIDVAYILCSIHQLFTLHYVRGITVSQLRGALDDSNAGYVMGMSDIMNAVTKKLLNDIITKISTGENRDEFQELLDKLFNGSDE